MFIVVYRPHGAATTDYYGVFDLFDDAYEFLCKLPAIGQRLEGEQSGYKFVEELTTPSMR